MPKKRGIRKRKRKPQHEKLEHEQPPTFEIIGR